MIGGKKVIYAKNRISKGRKWDGSYEKPT